MRLGPPIWTLCMLALAFPAGAPANDFQRIFQDYRQNGQLNGCYNPAQLHDASRQIPPDIEQYAPGFADALRAGQSGCGAAGGGSAPAAAAEEDTSPPAAVSAGTPGRGTPTSARQKVVKDPPTPKKAAEPVLAALPRPSLAPTTAAAAGGGTPGGLVALLVAAGLAGLAALGWAVAWFMGWSPERFTRPLTAGVASVFSRR